MRATAVCASVLALTACGGSIGSSPIPASSASPSPATATTVCETIKLAFADALTLPWAVTNTTFTDIASGTHQQGCQLTTKGTDVQIKDFVDVSQRLSTLLTNEGWGTAQPLADGPTGTVIGFNGGAQLGQLTVEWQPSPGANCPQNKPITDCTLLPEQKLYTIKLEVATSGSAGSTSGANDVLQQAVHTYVMENTDVRSFTLVVDGVEGSIARVRVVPTPGTADSMVAYAHHETAGWSVLAVGTSFGTAFYEQHAIPASLQLGHS